VTVDNDETGGKTVGVKLVYGTKKEAQAEIPRRFGINVPVFRGAWEPGAEKYWVGKIALRVIPPKGDGVEPSFWMTFVDADDVLDRATDQLCQRVEDELTGVNVYRGTPSVVVY
jgi:hypothetical protein